MSYDYANFNDASTMSQSDEQRTSLMGIVEKSDGQYCLLLTGDADFIDTYLDTYSEICSDSEVRAVDCSNVDVNKAMVDSDYAKAQFESYF